VVGALLRADQVEPRSCATGLPAYFYPHPDDRNWPATVRLGGGSLLVVNPANGPGAAADVNYLSVLRALGPHGPRVYGYVDTDYGSRPVATIMAESRKHRRWYGVSGIFLDQTAPDAGHLPYYERLVSALHAAGFTVALNPGQPDIDRKYVELADQVVTFEGPLDSYRRQNFPAWTHDYPAERYWHLVYDVPTAEAMHEVIRAARAHGAGLVYVTDRSMPNPWDGLPAYWEEERTGTRSCN
jgi:hypothetical protein